MRWVLVQALFCGAAFARVRVRHGGTTAAPQIYMDLYDSTVVGEEEDSEDYRYADFGTTPPGPPIYMTSDNAPPTPTEFFPGTAPAGASPGAFPGTAFPGTFSETAPAGTFAGTAFTEPATSSTAKSDGGKVFAKLRQIFPFRPFGNRSAGQTTTSAPQPQPPPVPPRRRKATAGNFVTDTADWATDAPSPPPVPPRRRRTRSSERSGGSYVTDSY